jgi:hypothetical protein
MCIVEDEESENCGVYKREQIMDCDISEEEWTDMVREGPKSVLLD